MAKTQKNTKKNHYNPKCYLSRFADEKERLHGYSVDLNKCINQKYSEWGFEKYLYTQQIEDLLEKYDSSFNSFMIKLEEGLEDISQMKLSLEDIQKVIYFLAIQLSRTPKAKAQIENIINQRKKEKPILHSMLEYNEMDIFSSQALFERYIFELLPEKITLLTSYQWTIIRSEDNAEFITSDHALGMGTINLSDSNNKKGLGLASKNTIKIFPLSKRICLVINDKNKGFISKNGNVEGLKYISNYPNKKVKHLNGLILAGAYKFAYGSSEKVLVEALAELKCIKRATEDILKST